MSRSPDDAAPWWHRRTPSLVAFAVAVAVAGLVTMALAGQVVEVLPEVGRDQLGDDRWSDPVGIELNGGLTIAHIPECAAGAVTRIALWDADSNPYWEVSGPPTPMGAFFVGATPEGFTEVEPYREPPADEVVRLVVFRRVGGVAGLRYQRSALRQERVVSGNPLRRFTVEGFRTARVCGGSDSAVVPESGTEPIPELNPAEPGGDGPDFGTEDPTGTTEPG